MTLEQALALIARLDAQNKALQASVADLNQRIAVLLERLGERPPDPPPPKGGKPRSKDSDPAPPPSQKRPKKDRTGLKRHNHGRTRSSAKLDRVEQVIPAPKACPHCQGCDVRNHDTEVTEEYDYVRGYVRVRRTLRKVGRCAGCLGRVTAPQPPMPFDRASCTSGLLAWLIHAKQALHLPLDRLRRELARMGARIPSATLTRWYARGTDLLRPIAEQLRRELLEGEHLRFDATGLKVLDFGRRRRPAIQGQMLVFCSPERAVYVFTTGKVGEEIKDFLTLGERGKDGKILKLKPWKGTATADACNVHDRVFRSGDVLEGGCNAHGLRKFRDDVDKAPALADHALHTIGRFYALEKEAREAGLTGEALRDWRRAHAGAIAADFHTWLQVHLDDLVPKHPIRKAMAYYLRHWDALMRFLTDPAVPLDNNLSERLLRSIALGRKNWMFAGGPDGAQRVCTALSLLETCKLIGVDPCAYLEWALERVVPHPDNRGLTAAMLTPQAYKAGLEQEGAARKAA